MVAIAPTGKDIISKIRAAHPELDPASRIGVVSSFCHGTKVASIPERKSVVISATLSTDDIDLDKERVIPDGIDFDAYIRKNRKAFVDHDYGYLSCVGFFRSIGTKDNKVRVAVQMIYDPENPLIRAVIKLAEQDTSPMSLGFKELEGGTPTSQESKQYPGKAYMVRKSIAIEGSFTCLPCNVSCQSDGVYYVDESKAASAREILAKSRVPMSVWGRLGLAEKRTFAVTSPTPRRKVTIVCCE